MISLPERVYSFSSSDLAAAKKILEYDPYLDGSLSSEDLQKLKGKISSLKRASEDEEKKIIEIINKERSEGEQGLGMIFG